MTILKTTPILTYSKELCAISLILSLVCFVALVLSCKRKNIIYFFITWLIFLGFGFFFRYSPIMTVDTGRFQHEVLRTEDFSFVEAGKDHNIVRQEGNVLIIEDK